MEPNREYWKEKLSHIKREYIFWALNIDYRKGRGGKLILTSFDCPVCANLGYLVSRRNDTFVCRKCKYEIREMIDFVFFGVWVIFSDIYSGLSHEDMFKFYKLIPDSRQMVLFSKKDFKIFVT